MTVPYSRPGVSIAVVGSPAFLAPGASGGITAVIGTAPKGYGGANPAVYTSLADFSRDYGDPATYPYPAWTLPQAAALYFAQAGLGSGLRPGLVVNRIGTVAAADTLVSSVAGTSLTLTAQTAITGTVGNSISVTVAAVSGGTQVITITGPTGAVETYTDTNPTTTPASTLLALINQSSQIVTASAATDSVNPFTAGTFAFTGGADGQGTAIAQANFDALSAIPCEFVTPLDGLQATAILAQAHADSMSANFSRPRVAAVGPAIGTSVATMSTNLTALADTAGRVTYFGHDSIKVANPATGAPQLLPGFYGAVATDGAKCADAVFQSTTGQLLQAVQGVGTPLTDTQLDTLAGAGATVLTVESGFRVVRHGLTTAPSSSSYSRLVNRTCEDELANRSKAFALAQIVGKPDTRDMPGLIASGETAVCNRALTDTVIAGVGAIAVSRVSQGNYSVTVPYAQVGEVDYLTLNLSVTA